MAGQHLDPKTLTEISSEHSWPKHRLHCTFYGHNKGPSGDSFVLEESDGCITFAIADAAGHGEQAALFWDKFGEVFQDCWNQFLVGFESIDERLQAFADTLNEALYSASHPELISNHLCLAIGEWSDDGSLAWANFGYGSHVLPRTKAGGWWAAPEMLFGLKLGWISSSMRSKMPRAFVMNRAIDVDRVILMTDAFLGDDYDDPNQTLLELGQLNDKLAVLPFEQAKEKVLSLDEAPTDDVTLLVMERLDAES